jgi:hypothetical protein
MFGFLPLEKEDNEKKKKKWEPEICPMTCIFEKKRKDKGFVS